MKPPTYVVRKQLREQTLRVGRERTGECLCGRPVAEHFDDRNAKFSCEFVAQLRVDEKSC